MRKGKTVSVIVLLAALTLLHGCAANRATATVDQTTDLSTLQVFYVKKYTEDTRDTNIIIKNKLVEMGELAPSSRTGIGKV